MKISLPRGAARGFATLLTIAAAFIGSGPLTADAQQPNPDQTDKYTWLEDINGERPLAWVKAEDARTAAVLEKDPHFAPLEADALKVLESPERLPQPQFRNGTVYNTWRDAEHVRGIVRRTSIKGTGTTAEQVPAMAAE